MKYKDYYDDPYVLMLGEKLSAALPRFDGEAFTAALTGQLDDKTLFQRFDAIVDAMEAHMDGDYAENLSAFSGILGPALTRPEGMFRHGWWLWPIGRYVERCGVQDWALSLSFLKELTKRFTGEFAVRPLLKAHPDQVMDVLLTWTADENAHVRRLASEGVRIRLPWAEKCTAALDQFQRYTQILTNLKDDPERFVQKSVGNNLNDLFKEAPDRAAHILAQWERTPPSKARDWIVRHGMRNQV